MKGKKIIIFSVSILLVFIIAFNQLNKKETVHADYVSYESLAEYVKSYETSSALKSIDVIDEKKYAEQYFFKKNLVSEKMTEAEAKKQAYDQIVEETTLFDKAKSLGLLASKSDAKILSDEARTFLKEEPEANEEIIQIKNDIIKGLGITEDEYFNKILIDRYVVDLSINNLYEHVTKDFDDEEKEKIWTEFKRSEVASFVSKNEAQLNKFVEFNNVELK